MCCLARGIRLIFLLHKKTASINPNTQRRNNTMTTYNTFTSREQYISWRAEWRTEYNNLSIAIRTLKHAIADTHRAGDYAGTQQSRLLILQADAEQMITKRAFSKIRAGLLRNNPDLSGTELESKTEAGYAAFVAKHEAARIASREATKVRIAAKIAEKKLKASSHLLAAD
jgi:hypothetical protein